jgi:transposase InsO family protein
LPGIASTRWIFNTDQGSQFTSHAFTTMLIDADIAIGVDGKGAWRDNIFVERLWRSLKNEEVYLRAYASVPEARESIGRYLDFYNRKRPHQGLAGITPIRPSSTRCRQSRRRPDVKGAKPLIVGTKNVQTNRATSRNPKARSSAACSSRILPEP